MKKYVVTLVLAFTGIVSLSATGVVLNRNSSVLDCLYLAECDYQADIQNQVAMVTVTEVFRNLSMVNFNPRYYYPNQEGASPTQLRWFINGEWHVAEIAGTPSNPQGGPSTFPTYFTDYVGVYPVVFDFNMALVHEDSLVVELSYVQLLPYSFGNVEMLLKNNYSTIQTTPLQHQEFEITLDSDRIIQSFLIPGFDAEITPGEHHASAVYSLDNATAAQDYHMLYSLTQDALTLSAMSGIFDPPDDLSDGFLTFIAEPDNSDSEYINKVFTLIIDHSGSMSGNKIVQAKAAATYITNNLNPGDKFNLIAFNEQVTTLWATHQEINHSTQQVAQTFISNLYALGSTNISGAFGTAVPQFSNTEPNTANIIIFFTDGQATVGITNTNALITYVDNLITQTETVLYLFDFGIGNDANRQLLTTLSLDNNGISEFLENNELEETITAFYDLIRYPVMLSPTFSVTPGNAINEVYPDPLPNLYRGKQLIVSGRYQTAQPISITFAGNVYGQQVQYPYNASLCETQQPGLEFLPKIWAKQKIESLIQLYYTYDEDSAEAIALHQQIVDISIAYGIVCIFTSFTGGETENDDVTEPPPAAEIVLLGNFPNPFNPTTTIRFEVIAEVRGPAFICIYNSRGQLVKVLGLHVNRAGTYEVVWDGTDQEGRTVSSGNYFYTISLDKYILTGKMTMIK